MPTNLASTSLLEQYTVPFSSRLSVRLYRDCRPSCLETASLQKGLVLLWGDRELIEEGVGLGLPIVKYADKTFFSNAAEVSFEESESGGCILTKVFNLNTVSVKTLGESTPINDNVYSTLRKIFQRLYLKHKNLNFLFNKIMETRQLFKIKTEFQTVKPRGTITVRYHCQPFGIEVEADFSKVTLNNCQEILVLNEQGSGIFQKYVDSSGNALVGKQIGAWDPVSASAASLQTSNGLLSFTLKKRVDARLFRGWERTMRRFSWAGLSYSLAPTNGVFRYSIVLNGNRE